MRKSIVFRLITGYTPATWSISGGQAIKEGKGVKQINYYPGSDSYFVEDNKDNDLQPETVVLRYNDVLSDPATEIIVPEENKVLIAYLKAYPGFGKHYAIHDEDLNAEKQVQNYDQIEKALSLIKETDTFKLQAMALAVVGQEAYGLSPVKCAAALKQKAITTPSIIIDKFESANYESTYLAALAMFSGIVKENHTNSAVIWNDGKDGHIIPLAKGERGLDKLSEFLSEPTDESRLVIQEISNRIDRIESEAPPATGVALKSNEPDAKDLEIAKLRAMLEEKNTPPVDAPTRTLAETQEAYKEKFKRELPPIQKNNQEWLEAKLAE